MLSLDFTWSPLEGTYSFCKLGDVPVGHVCVGASLVTWCSKLAGFSAHVAIFDSAPCAVEGALRTAKSALEAHTRALRSRLLQLPPEFLDVTDVAGTTRIFTAAATEALFASGFRAGHSCGYSVGCAGAEPHAELLEVDLRIALDSAAKKGDAPAYAADHPPKRAPRTRPQETLTLDVTDVRR